MRTTSYDALVVGYPDRRAWKDLGPMSIRLLTALAYLVLAVLTSVFLLSPGAPPPASARGPLAVGTLNAP